jgi:hypothetical protein
MDGWEKIEEADGELPGVKAAAEKWMLDYLRQLEGATILKIELDDDGSPLLTIRTTDGRPYIVAVSRDEEGNGPGFLHGLPEPEAGS